LIEPATAPFASAPSRDPASSIRVLLGASDRRFLRVASFLLGRNGFSVATAHRMSDLMDAIERGRADVVVLDASGPERWPVRAAAALDAGGAQTAVLVVADGVEGTANALPKWGSFDRLVEEIRRAHARLEAPEAVPA
jgi:DNA-binding NtrC family response regulator